jgi:hypothetical protein
MPADAATPNATNPTNMAVRNFMGVQSRDRAA